MCDKMMTAVSGCYRWPGKDGREGWGRGTSYKETPTETTKEVQDGGW